MSTSPSTAGQAPSKRPARNRLLEAASRLFYANGIAGTGIDKVTTEAGVAKMSLYNNFSSKDELILAYIQARHQEWLDLYDGHQKQANSALKRILAVFDAYIDHAESAYHHVFRGCGLLNAAAELPADSPGREAVRKHKEQVENILHAHLTELVPPEEAAPLAEHLSFTLEGAMSRAGLEGHSARLKRAKTLAETMLDTRLTS